MLYLKIVGTSNKLKYVYYFIVHFFYSLLLHWLFFNTYCPVFSQCDFQFTFNQIFFTINNISIKGIPSNWHLLMQQFFTHLKVLNSNQKSIPLHSYYSITTTCHDFQMIIYKYIYNCLNLSWFLNDNIWIYWQLFEIFTKTGRHFSAHSIVIVPRCGSQNF